MTDGLTHTPVGCLRSNPNLIALPASRFPLPPSPLRVKLRTQLRLRRRAFAEQMRDDPVAVIAAILDEDLVGVVSGNDNSGNEYTGHRRLECVRVVLWYPRRRTDGHAAIPQQIEAGRKTCHDVDAVGPESRFAIIGGKNNFRRNDCADAAVPPRGDLALLYP